AVSRGRGKGKGKGKAAPETSDEESSSPLSDEDDDDDEGGQGEGGEGEGEGGGVQEVEGGLTVAEENVVQPLPEVKEALDSLPTAFVELQPHHYEEIRGGAEAKYALMGRGWFYMKRVSQKRGPFTLQMWNPRPLDRTALGKLVKSYHLKGVESWKAPIDVVLRREWIANEDELLPGDGDTWDGLQAIKIKEEHWTTPLKIAAGQHRFEALQKFEAEKEKKAAKEAKEAAAKKKKKAAKKTKEEEEQEEDPDYEDGPEYEEDEDVGAIAVEGKGPAYWFICRFWDATKVEANGGRIGMYISRNRTRPEKEEGEAERFLLGLATSRVLMDAKRAELGRELTLQERKNEHDAALGSLGVSRSAEGLLRTDYIMDVASEMKHFGMHFVNWDNFHSSRVREMFVGTHGRMLAAMAMSGLHVWANVLRPVKFETRKKIGELATRRARVVAPRTKDSKAELATRRKQVADEDEELTRMMEAGLRSLPLYELMLSSPFMTEVGIAFVETLGNPRMLTRLGLRRGEDAEYDKAFDKYVEQIVEAAKKCEAEEMYEEMLMDEAGEVMVKHLGVKVMYVMDRQRDGQQPQMPLLTTQVLNNMHALLKSVDESIAEVIRWFEPGFDISRANSTKDGWKDRSHAFYEWLASYSTQWIGGVDRAFEQTAAGPSTKAPATTAPKTTAPKAVTATNAAAGGASTSKEGVVGVARTPGEVKAMAQAASRARALERRRKARAEAIVVDEENEGRASPTLPGSSSEEEGVEGTTKGQEKEVGDADAEGEVDEGAAGGDGEIVPATQGADKVDPPTQGPATSAAPAPATEGAGQLPAGTPASPLTQVTETEVEATQRGPTDGRPTDTQMAEPATSQLSMGRLDPIEDVDDDMEGRAPPSTITQFEEPARPATPTVAGGLGKRRAGDLSPQSRNLGQAGRARGHPTPTGEQGGEEEEGSGAFDTQPLRQALS
ncbi:hypothetical protein DENSPDRAFT_902996, partial [Dentipellis sp. KUC8613]